MLIPQTQVWTAYRTGNRFRVKAPVRFGGILGATSRTEFESCHARVGPLIRNGREKAIAWAALSAGEERISKATVVWIIELAPAVCTSGEIWWNDKNSLTRLSTLAD